MATHDDSTRMTPDDKARLMGAELSRYTDEFVAAYRHTADQQTALGNLLAAVLGRVTALAAGSIVLYDERMADAERRLNRAERDIKAAHKRSDGNASRITELHTRLNGRANQIDALTDHQESAEERERRLAQLDDLAQRVERLEQRAVGERDANR